MSGQSELRHEGTVAHDVPVLRWDRDGEPLRLLHVHAHPDDESSKGAATTARYVAEGVEVVVVTCTGGERGSILNPAMERPDIEANIAAVRQAEMAAARKILGVEQVWLGFVDSGLPEGDPLPPLPEGCFALADVDEATRRLVRVIREVRPHVMTTYNEHGGYPHPDHIMTHKISMAAYAAAAEAERWPEQGPPWAVSKLYYDVTFHRAKWEALDAAMRERGLESPYAERLAERRDDQERSITTRVPTAAWFGVRDAALLAHATQVDPDGRWFAAPLDLQQRAWPTEDFELARSRIEIVEPEDDLFAGIAGPAAEELAAEEVRT